MLSLALARLRAKLLKLVIEGLPVCTDTGIADEPVLRVSFDHILWHPISH